MKNNPNCSNVRWCHPKRTVYIGCFPISGLYRQVKCYKCCNLRRFTPQILSMFGLAARPFRKQMCQSALERRRSSSEVGKAGKSGAILTGGISTIPFGISQKNRVVYDSSQIIWSTVVPPKRIQKMYGVSYGWGMVLKSWNIYIYLEKDND